MRAFILAVTGLAIGVTACGSYGTSVEVQQPQHVASVSVALPSSSLVAGQTLRAIATPKDAEGNALTDRPISWYSSSAAVAAVSDVGVISAVAPGTATVSAVSEGVSGQAAVTVLAPAPVPVATVSVSPASSSLPVGTTVQLSATTYDANNTVLTGRSVGWSSVNAGIASVTSNGLVSAVSAGTTQITASSEGKSTAATITVSAPGPVPVATVSVSPASSSLIVGATVQLSATMRDASNNVLTGRQVAWLSSDITNAVVDSNGLVSTVSSGAATITASSEGKSGSAAITIAPGPPPPDTVPQPPPPPPPPPGSSNEPAGMTVLAERPFNSLQEDPSWIMSGWSIAQDATAPKSQPNVIRATYPTGFAGGSSPGNAEESHSGRRVLYISYWAKLSSNFQGHLTGVNKQIYEWANGNPIVYFEARGGGNGTLSPTVVLQGTPADAVYSPNLVPGAGIPRDQWYNIEIVLTGNSSGGADGSVDWWLDGVHVGSRSGVRFTSAATSWSIFSLRPIWGGVGDVVSATMTLDFDHIYLSGKN